MSDTFRAIDPRELLQACAGDLALFRHLSQVFLDTAPGLYDRMHAACCPGPGGAPERFIAASHALRGITALAGARSLTALLAELEHVARISGCPATAALAPAEALLAAVCAEVRRSMATYSGATP